MAAGLAVGPLRGHAAHVRWFSQCPWGAELKHKADDFVLSVVKLREQWGLHVASQRVTRLKDILQEMESCAEEQRRWALSLDPEIAEGRRNEWATRRQLRLQLVG